MPNPETTTFENQLRQKAARMFSEAHMFILGEPVFVKGVLPISGAGITLKPGVYIGGVLREDASIEDLP